MQILTEKKEAIVEIVDGSPFVHVFPDEAEMKEFVRAVAEEVFEVKPATIIMAFKRFGSYNEGDHWLHYTGLTEHKKSLSTIDCKDPRHYIVVGQDLHTNRSKTTYVKANNVAEARDTFVGHHSSARNSSPVVKSIVEINESPSMIISGGTLVRNPSPIIKL